MGSFKSEIIFVLFFLIASNTLGQTNAAEETPQYLFKSFSSGNVLLKSNEIKPAIMNYNTVTENMVFEQNEKLLDLIDLHLIDTVYLQNTKFIPVREAFYEVIMTSPLPLFIQHKGTLLSPGKTVAYGGTSDLAASTRLSTIMLSGGYYNLPLPNDFKVKLTSIYWLNRDGEMISFSNVRQLRKLFPEKKNEIKKLIKKERLKIESREDLVKIIRFCAGDTQ